MVAARAMPGYTTKQERIDIQGVDDLIIRSLLDRQQFSDPVDEALRLGINSASWPLFGLLWPSGAQLAAHLAQRPVTAEKILELGCGIGLASLVGHRRGADITASDRHPLTQAFLDENTRLNDLPPLPYLHGDWGLAADAPPLHRPDTSVRARVIGRFDLLIGSDLLYERDLGPALADFIVRHASASAEVWIVDPDRSNRAAFSRCMEREGFVRSEKRLDQMASADHPSYKGRLLTFLRSPSGLA